MLTPESRQRRVKPSAHAALIALVVCGCSLLLVLATSAPAARGLDRHFGDPNYNTGIMAAAPAVSAAFAAPTTTSIDNAVHQRLVPLAQRILTLARSKSPHVRFNLYGALTGYYEVSVRVNAAKAFPLPYLQGSYSLYAIFPRPTGSAVGVVRRSDFGKLKAREAVDIVINGGAQQLMLQRNTYPPFVPRFLLRPFPPGWLLHGNYLDNTGHMVTLAASTRPELKHQLRLTLAKLESIAAQARQLLSEAAADDPTNFLPPAFPHVRGENDSLPPPIY
jgi:hypothetical protein